jgi:hypothetical protein
VCARKSAALTRTLANQLPRAVVETGFDLHACALILHIVYWKKKCRHARVYRATGLCRTADIFTLIAVVNGLCRTADILTLIAVVNDLIYVSMCGRGLRAVNLCDLEGKADKCTK